MIVSIQIGQTGQVGWSMIMYGGKSRNLTSAFEIALFFVHDIFFAKIGNNYLLMI